MRTTQLACPYCQSTLTFGEDIAPGIAVPCLICGRAFVPAAVTVSDACATATLPPVQATPRANAEAPIPRAQPSPAPPSAVQPPMVVTLATPAPAAPPPLPPIPLPAAADAEPTRLAALPAASVPAAPVRVQTPQGNSQALLAGGLVFAGLAVLMIAGMSLVLWLAFGRHTPAAEVGGNSAPGAQAPDNTPGSTALAGAMAKPGAHEVDLADLKQPDAPKPNEPLTGRAGRDDDRAAPPTVPIIVPAGNPAGLDQQRIDAAIDKGVRYLKEHQKNGTWPGVPDTGFTMGFTALAGLTLLECKVPPTDPSVLKAASYVRRNVDSLNHSRETYQLALAILFLDRLGDPRDDAVIQRMALRLMTGQNEAGGWTYKNKHPPSTPEMKQLLVFLKSHRPPTPLAKALLPAGGVPGKQMTEPVSLPKQVQEPGTTLPKQVSGSTPDPKDNKVNKAIDSKLPAAGGANAEPKPAPPKKIAPIPLRNLLPGLQHLPIAQVNVNKSLMPGPARGEDNSNTQFALMGLWAARRHDVPTEHALMFAKKRYSARKDGGSQNDDGGWGYHWGHGSTNTMTCVGLIGLAMGHGVSADIGKDKAKLQDPTIQRGLTRLGKYIGMPGDKQQPNLYFLWSLERVAMLYDLKTIGGKDWYAWGAQALVVNQQQDGNWTRGGYPGANDHCDTCFALLFLRRSNLVPDLTENLRLYMVIRDPEAQPPSPGRGN